MQLSAEANNVRLAILEEPEDGFATKVTVGAPQILRQTGETLAHTAEYVESNEINNTRQVTDIIRVDIGAGGSIPFEISSGTYDALFRASLMSQYGWNSADPILYNGGVLTFTVDGVANTVTSSDVGNEPFKNLKAGDYISLSNFVEAANNNIFRVTAVSDNKEVLTLTPSLTTEAAVDGDIVIADVKPNVLANFIFTAATNSISGIAGKFLNFAVGEWIKVTGSVLNNVYAKIESIDGTGTTMVVSHATLQDENVLSTVTQLQSIVNASRKRSFNIERAYEDVANDYALYVGMNVGGFSIQASLKSIMTGSFEFLGSRELSETVPFGNAPYLPVTTSKVMSSVDSVEGVFANGEISDSSDFSITVDNALSAKNVLGTLGAKEFGSNPISVKGNANIYYAGPSFYSKYLNNENVSVVFRVEDETGHGYIFDMPTVRLTSGDRASKGKGNNIMSATGFQASMDGDEGITIRIVRY